MTWKAEAHAIIQSVTHAFYKEHNLPIAEPLDAQHFELYRKTLCAAYPWGPRKHYPYKAWLEAQRESLAQAMGSPPPCTKQRDAKPKKSITPEGQLSLF